MFARCGFGRQYECKKDWPEDCFVQAGDNGLVLSKDSMEEVFRSGDPLKSVIENTSYTTAFFEAFPKKPSTFIRGEGKTVEEAEASAFEKFEKYSICIDHKFEARGYRNGGGFCEHCGMFSSDVIPPEEECELCGEKTWYHLAEIDDKNHTWCRGCKDDVPENWKSASLIAIEKSIAYFRKRRGL